MGDPKPFHRTIVEAIKRARDAHELSILAVLINETEILRNHDAIVEAWKVKLAELGIEVTFSIIDSVMGQKPNRLGLSPHAQFMAHADDIATEVAEMSDEEVQAYLKEQGLEDLVSPERIEAILQEALGNPQKAAKLILIWDRDKDKSKSED